MAETGPRAPAKQNARPTLLILLLFLLLIASRLWGLDHQAFHHDESIHSKAIWSLARDGPTAYRYDPVYHAPLFYHLGAMASTWLPDTDFTARLPFALAGIALVAAGLLLAPVAGWRAAALAIALLTLSPTVTYYSRFAREDVVMAAILAWLVAAGALYLHTRRLRWLTVAWLCIVLGYCNKENSYINGFLVCSFVVLCGAWQALFRGPAGRRRIFLDYLPLARLLVIFGSFSLFVFLFVAIDARIGPDTPLAVGLGRIIRHSVAISREAGESAKILRGQSGFLTATGRGEVLRLYMLTAISLPLVLLVLLESIAARLRGSGPGGTLAHGTLALVGYTAAAAWLAQFYQWAGGHSGVLFLEGLRRQLVTGWLLLSGLALLAALPALFSGRFRDRCGSGWTRWEKLLRLVRPRLREWWVLVFQVIAAPAIFCVLFSSLGTNAPAGLRAGLYNYVAYWFRQQTGDFRIWGEWWYYLPRLALYEAAPLVIITLCLAVALRRRNTGAVVTPFAWFALWLSAGTIGVYALLNEKVGWLAIYQAYALNLLAALLLARMAGDSRARLVPGCVLAAAAAFGCWQHALAVHVHPDNATEPMAYVTTSREYLNEMRRMEHDHWAAVAAGRTPPLIALWGEGAWPGAWYLRRLRTTVTPFAADSSVQVLDNTPENKRRLDWMGDYAWEQHAVRVRGWWFANGEGLPDGNDLPANIAAFFLNAFNDHREAFPAGVQPPTPYVTGFARQLLAFVFLRRPWFPDTGSTVLVARKTGKRIDRQGVPVWLDGLDRTPRVSPVVSRLDGGGTLKAPRALCVLEDGTLAVADSGNGRIAILDDRGNLLRQVGEGILSREVTGPCGLAVGTDGVLYVADTWNHALRAFSPSGDLLASCDSVPLEGQSGRLFGPRGIAAAVDADGAPRLYATDTGNCRVVVLDGRLQPQMTWSLPGRNPGLLSEPVGIAVDAEGSVFVADTGNGRIQQFDSQGGYIREFPVYLPDANERLSAEPQLTLLPDGQRIAMTYATRGLFVVISPGEGRAWPWKPEVAGVQPAGVAFSADWTLYLSDRHGNAILRLAEQGGSTP